MFNGFLARKRKESLNAEAPTHHSAVKLRTLNQDYRNNSKFKRAFFFN